MQNAELLMVYHDEVRDALAAGCPVVALESNVITHGFRYPDNVTIALAVEAAVRAAGAVPATLWIDQGRMMIGIDSDELERVAVARHIPKASSRDLSVLLATRQTGVTTVAASLVIAELAGIPVFGTAGIGGVHRGAQHSMDISADLMQLTRSRVAVVCAGAKSILDLPLTLEFLETQCVPMIGYCSDEFPAFYCVSSGLRMPHRLDDEAVIARAIRQHWALGHPGAVLVTSPISEQTAIPAEDIELAITEALAEAARHGVRGAGLTAYVMRAVDDATAGRAARANAAVLIDTATVAARIAMAYAQQQREDV